MAENYEGRVFRGRLPSGESFVLDAPTSYGAMVEEREKFYNRHNIGRKRKTIKEARADAHKRGLEEALVRALKRIDGLANGAQCAERITIILAHVREHGKLPEETALPGGGP